MKKRPMLMIGLGVCGLIAVAAGIWGTMQRIKTGPPNDKPAEPDQLIDTRSGPSELKQVQKGNTLAILPKHIFAERAPFYLDKTKPEGASGFTFMYYYSDRRSLFYRFNPRLNRPELCSDVPGNIDGGTVTNHGAGVLYREMVAGNYLEGNLYHQVQGRPLRKILKRCNWYVISPDRRQVIAGGIPFADRTQSGRKVYLYNLERRTLSEIAGVVGPEDWEELLSLTCSWSSNSRYVYLEDKVFDSEPLRLLKAFPADGARRSMFSWSPDGKQLAFAVQSPANAAYSLSEEHRDLFLSDRLGIYNLNDQSLRSLTFPASLIGGFVWGQDGKRIAAVAVPLEAAAAYVNRANGSGPADRLELLLIDSVALKTVPILTQAPLTEVNALAGEVLIFTQQRKGHPVISACRLSDRTVQDLLAEDLLAAEVSRKQVYLAAASGVYRIDSSLKLTRLTDHSGEGELLILPEARQIVTGLSDRIDVIRF